MMAGDDSASDSPTLDDPQPAGRPPVLPAALGRYVPEAILGRGGMGIVYLARDRELDRRVAIKALHPEFARDARLLARLEREARLLALLSHPAIETIYSLERADGEVFLILEHIRGEALDQRLGRGPLPLDEALKVASQVASALRAAHTQRVIHRDLKPANVRLDEAGNAKVLDFGLARRLLLPPEGGRPRAVDRGCLTGTPGYLSPEQALGQDADERSDVFCLATLVVECLTGRPLWPGATATERIASVLRGQLDLSGLPGALPEPVQGLLARALRQDPAERLTDLKELCATLEWARMEATPHEVGREGSVRSNLPRRLSRFIGRTAELNDVEALLRRSALVTLVGVAGGGKTRLALEAASRLWPPPEDGIALVELAPIADASRVAQAVARAIGASLKPSLAAHESLLRGLEQRALLLVFDNCEHLHERTAALVHDILSRAPGCRILATSREALGVPGERCYLVPPLAAADARELFLERAAGSAPGLDAASIDPATAEQICGRLDRVPLAIELAAARLALMSPRQLLERLPESVGLTATSRDAQGARQATMLAALDWSHELLDADTRKLFARLDVFHGGFTLEAAEAVLGDPALPREGVLACLHRLVKHSLVVVDRERSEPRFRLLFLVQQYAAARLAGQPAAEREQLRDQHLHYLVDLAERAAAGLESSGQIEWLARLDHELENFRAALDRAATAPGRLPEAMRLATALGRHGYIRGYWEELRQVYGRLLRHAGAEAPARARTGVQVRLAQILWRQGNLSEARELIDRTLDEARRLEDAEHESLGLTLRANIHFDSGDVEGARRDAAASRALCERRGDRRGLASVLNAQGRIASETGEPDVARRCFSAARDLLLAGGDPVLRASLEANLGVLSMNAGDFAAARRQFTDALRFARETEAVTLEAYALMNLGEVAYVERDDLAALELHSAAHRLHARLGDRFGLAVTELGQARAFVRRGESAMARKLLQAALRFFHTSARPQGLAEACELLAQLEDAASAVRLLGSVARFREAHGAARAAATAGEVRLLEERLRRELGEQRYAELWEEGLTTPLEALVAAALR